MKQKPTSMFAMASMFPAAIGSLAISLSTAHAVDVLKNDTNATGPLDPLSWVGGFAPGASDVAVWDNTVLTANQSALPGIGANSTFGGIRIVNPVSNVGFNVNSGRALSIGADGINMSAAEVDLTIGGAGIVRPVSTLTANFTDYNVAFGRSLTINATFQASANTTTVEFPGAGATNINKLPATTSLILSNIGSGTVTLGGTATSSTTQFSASGAGAKNVINGPTISTSQLGSYGGGANASSFELQAGAVNFNAGIRSLVDGCLIKVTNGAFTTTTLELRRSSNISLGGNAPSNSGFVAVGGTASITTLQVGSAGTNSSASALVDGGAVSISDNVNIGNTTGNIRWNTLQVNSGSLTVSGTSGIQLSTNTTVANLSQVRFTGGTTTTEAINYGVAASAADSRGELVVGSGATLYVGSGNVNLVSLNTYTANFTANGGTIGAKATWTSAVPVALSATSTFKAADAADASFDINLNGGVSGVGGLTKTGGGILTLGLVASSYSGDTTVSNGTLSLAQANVSNESSTVSIASGAFLNLNFAGTDTVDKLFINGVQQLAGVYEAVGNPAGNTETARITGSGTLTVTSNPPGVSGFGTWITGTFTNGSVAGDQQGPNDDPDSDGIDNLTEYALADLDPTVGNAGTGTFTDLTLSFAKRQPLASDITYTIEASTDLGISDVWDPVSPLVNDGTTISYTLLGVSPTDFVRLKVVKN